MKTKLIITFFLLLPIVDVFYSCCNCDAPKHHKYIHKTLIVKNLDNSGVEAIESESFELNKNTYGIRLYVTREKSVVARTKQTNSIFTQSAYAFDCWCLPAYTYSPTDSIISIKVFTLNDFDNQHPENSDITDLFRIAHSYLKIGDYVKNLHFTYKSDFEEHFEQELKIDFLLMTVPATTNSQQFKIQVVLSNRRILEQQTTEIKLL